jgi:PKD repeat protein
VVQFAALASDPENDALSYNWSFGDGSTATGASVSHIYASAGSYTATVTVNDASNTISNSISVQIVAARPLNLSKLNGTANLAVSGKDTCSLMGALALPTNYNPLGVTLDVNVGGARATFILDRSGNARTAIGTVALKVPTGKKSASQSATLQINLKAGNWSDAWKSEWLQLALNQNAASAEFEVEAIVVGATYSTTANVGLTVVRGKFAKFKLKK